LIYLDNAASTAVHPEVVKEMLPYFDVQYGNPSSIHQFGRKAKNAIQKARKQVAALVGAEPNEILFTSGGTESNNTILYGIPKSQGPKFVLNHIITSSIEHEAILEPCRDLEKNGVKVTYLPVDEHGIVNPNDIINSINPASIAGWAKPVFASTLIADKRGWIISGTAVPSTFPHFTCSQYVGT